MQSSKVLKSLLLMLGLYAAIGFGWSAVSELRIVSSVPVNAPALARKIPPPDPKPGGPKKNSVEMASSMWGVMPEA